MNSLSRRPSEAEAFPIRSARRSAINWSRAATYESDAAASAAGLYVATRVLLADASYRAGAPPGRGAFVPWISRILWSSRNSTTLLSP